MEEPVPLLSVKQLNIGFGDFTAVSGIDFDLFAGEITALVGESGSGKTLTGLALMRLLPEAAHHSGQIILQLPNRDSLSLSNLSEVNLRYIRGGTIGMIFQHPDQALNPVFTIGSQLREVAAIHRRDLSLPQQKKLIREWLRRVGMEETDRFLSSFPHQLSGGQLQRVVIAQALIGQPALLIADEPTSGLDAQLQERILLLLKGLVEELNLGLLLISHDLKAVVKYSDRCLVMQSGQLLERGSTRELSSEAKHPYTRGLFSVRPPLTERLHRLPVMETFLSKKSIREAEQITTALHRSPEYWLEREESLADKPVAVQVNDLTISYPMPSPWWKKAPTILALHPISFVVHQSQTLGIIGESGSGKSSLLRAIMGLVIPESGTISFPNTSDMGQRHHFVQIVFQHPFSSLNPRYTAQRTVVEAITLRKGSKQINVEQEAASLFERVGLDWAIHKDRLPSALSGGQCQRLAIARALAMKPALLLCDEVTSALDVTVQARIVNLLLDLQAEEGLSLIFASHDPAIVRAVSDQVIVLKEGKVVEEGQASKLYAQPISDYTKALVGR